VDQPGKAGSEVTRAAMRGSLLDEKEL